MLYPNNYNPINKMGIYKYFNEKDELCELLILAISEDENPKFPEKELVDNFIKE